jgi:shikimate kinase
MKLLFLYGPPASGKFTVAKEVARLTDFKLFHNHLTLDLYEAIFDYGTELFRKLVEDTRISVLEQAAIHHVSGVIFTLVYEKDQDESFIGRVVDAVERHGGEVLFVQLYCQPIELKRRVSDESRKAFRKMSSPEALQRNMERYDLFSPIPGHESLCIDTTNLSPSDVAQQIISHYHFLLAIV